ncbi:hypothetical protein G7046_g9200 [Stylonectria norvegica]|nr:hypothetical protein G7046_g9200 [Stylonectria norvegica]
MASLQSKVPPQSPPTFYVAPQQLLNETESIINATKSLHDSLAESLTAATATFENLLLPIVADDHDVSRRVCIFRLFSSVSESSELRDASRKAEQLRSKADATLLMRRDIAALVAAVYKKQHAGELSLDKESAYMLFKTHRAYQNAGAGIQDEEVRKRYMDAVEERNDLLVAARKLLSESDEGIWFHRDQLDGVLASALDNMQESEDGESLKVTFKKGHLLSVMKHATSAKTRKTLFTAKENRFPENVERLKRIVVLRDEIARILGFETHAALKMEDKMAPSVEIVMSRLNGLRTMLKPLATAEIETLLHLKETMGDIYNDTGEVADATQMNAWDWGFYARILEKEKYSVDSVLIADYFEIRHSLEGMLRIFENLFSIHFIPAEAPTWQEDVTVYAASTLLSYSTCP